jgi:putative glutathione S-transferase
VFNSRPQIDEVNSWIYAYVNNGVYKAGFALTQQAYEMAFDQCFAALDKLDLILQKNRWLCGDRITGVIASIVMLNYYSEADVRLFPTIWRFDAIYYVRFKCNKYMIREYHFIQQWLENFWKIRGVAEASNMKLTKQGYYGNHGSNIVPIGPAELFGFAETTK